MSVEEPQFTLKVGGPDAVRITVCESCTRTSLFTVLKERHYGSAESGWCPGPLRSVTYTREDVTP